MRPAVARSPDPLEAFLESTEGEVTAMFSLDRTCPACAARFVPWRVWAITRWSCIACPHCGAQLNRELDWRFALVLVVSLAVLQVGTLLLVLSTSWPIWVLALLVFVLVFWLIDMRTVRLVVAKRRRGIRGYMP